LKPAAVFFLAQNSEQNFIASETINPKTKSRVFVFEFFFPQRSQLMRNITEITENTALVA
jgi:hypothetical protein